jgi:hypothetical protein
LQHAFRDRTFEFVTRDSDTPQAPGNVVVDASRHPTKNTRMAAFEEDESLMKARIITVDTAYHAVSKTRQVPPRQLI